MIKRLVLLLKRVNENQVHTYQCCDSKNISSKCSKTKT